MEAWTFSVYGLSAALNVGRRDRLMLAVSLFLIEWAHSLLHFEYAAVSYLTIAALTLIPVNVCRYVERELAYRIGLSCVGLMIIYFFAWLAWEFDGQMYPFKYAHIAILIYQFWGLNVGTGVHRKPNVLATSR